MKKKNKTIRALIVGALVITAFFRGTALDIALGVFFGILLLGVIARRVLTGKSIKWKYRNKTYELKFELKSGIEVKQKRKYKFRRKI
jgi:hypothetical protein